MRLFGKGGDRDGRGGAELAARSRAGMPAKAPTWWSPSATRRAAPMRPPKSSGFGRRARFIATDVSRKDEIERMVEAAMAEFGRIDVLVNNAGIHASQPFLEVSEESFDLLVNTNLRGAFFVAQAVARHMASARTGKIINMSSVSAEIADSGSSVYCVDKGAGCRC